MSGISASSTSSSTNNSAGKSQSTMFPVGELDPLSNNPTNLSNTLIESVGPFYGVGA